MQRKKAGKTRRLGSTDICEMCGKPYTVNGGMQRYCRVCAPVAIHKKALELTKAWNAENATPDGRRELRKAHAAKIACVICGKLFVPENAAVTCSKECSQALSEKKCAEYSKSHRAEINVKARDRRKAKAEAMSAEEIKAERAKANAASRENYAKRLEAMTPEELRAYLEKKRSQARARYIKNKPERFCIICGNPIPPDSNRRSFCSDACMIKKRSESNRKQYERRKEIKNDTD